MTISSLSIDDIAVGVFTSARNLRERALSVQRTWLRYFPKGFLIGGSCHDSKLRMINLDDGVREDFHSVHRKQFLGLMELYGRFPAAKWFFITGCDAFIYPWNLVKLLEGFDPEKELFIGGHCGTRMVAGEALVFPSGGPGFALSGALVKTLLPAIPGFILNSDLAYQANIAYLKVAEH